MKRCGIFALIIGALSILINNVEATKTDERETVLGRMQFQPATSCRWPEAATEALRLSNQQAAAKLAKAFAAFERQPFVLPREREKICLTFAVSVPVWYATGNCRETDQELVFSAHALRAGRLKEISRFDFSLEDPGGSAFAVSAFHFKIAALQRPCNVGKPHRGRHWAYHSAWGLWIADTNIIIIAHQ